MGDGNEAFARVKIDELLRDAGWKPDDGLSVRLEEKLTDGTKADYVLCDRHGRPMAVLEAKRAGMDPAAAQAQGRHYAQQLDVPFVFLSNGEEVWFLDRGADAHARRIDGFYGQEDLERRVAARQFRRDLSTVAIDRNVVNRDYQMACIEVLSQQVLLGRRKLLLVEVATGTGKTRTAAAFIKRLFQANMVTRVLFLVDRIALARQAEEAFTDHLRAYPCHVLRPGRRFDRAKLITVANLQTMVTEFRTLRERLWLGLKGLECPPEVELLRNGCPALAWPHTLNVTVRGVDGARLHGQLRRRVALSSGSSCSSATGSRPMCCAPWGGLRQKRRRPCGSAWAAAPQWQILTKPWLRCKRPWP